MGSSLTISSSSPRCRRWICCAMSSSTPGWRKTTSYAPNGCKEMGTTPSTLTQRRPARLLTALLLVFVAVSAWANEPSSAGVRWQDLTPEQQEILHRLEPRWDQLPHARQRELAQGAQRWASLSPEEQAEARERMKHWRSLDDEERREMRRRFREFKSLPSEQQERIRAHYERFKQLPPEKRRELREQFRKLSPREREQLRQRIMSGEEQ